MADIVAQFVAHSEDIRKWTGTLLGPAVTFFGFLFVYMQLKVSTRQAKIATDNLELATGAAKRAAAEALDAQIWRKAEFLADQVQAFIGDERVERVTYVLDWNTREIQLSGMTHKVLCLHDESSERNAGERQSLRQKFIDTRQFVVLSRALRVYDSKEDFTEEEMHVRDDFDWFLFRLGQFQHMIDAGLFSYAEADVHLSYVLDLLSGGIAHVSSKMDQVVSSYVDAYQFAAAGRLIRSRRASRQKNLRTIDA